MAKRTVKIVGRRPNHEIIVTENTTIEELEEFIGLEIDQFVKVHTTHEWTYEITYRATRNEEDGNLTYDRDETVAFHARKILQYIEEDENTDKHSPQYMRSVLLNAGFNYETVQDMGESELAVAVSIEDADDLEEYMEKMAKAYNH